MVDLVWMYGSGCAGVGAREGETVEMICNLLIIVRHAKQRASGFMKVAMESVKRINGVHRFQYRQGPKPEPMESAASYYQ